MLQLTEQVIQLQPPGSVDCTTLPSELGGVILWHLRTCRLTWILQMFSACTVCRFAGMVLRCAVYLAMYYSFSQPRAVIWQLYLITCAIYYACAGMAYVLSQVGMTRGTA
eukprot:GHUV01018805.1.p1 GENE.GHUV01018805.1~~GHUV01018805.1.p1  ORF type:complete len:110 (+),score=9.55 GHUV01018805.1:1472-1801(+)